MKRYRIMRDRY